MVLDKTIEEIVASDLHALVINAVSERKTLEYKQVLSVNLDDEKREFLADVS